MDQFRDRAGVVIVDPENNIDIPIETDRAGAHPDETTISDEIDQPQEENPGPDTPEATTSETGDMETQQSSVIQAAGQQAVLRTCIGGQPEEKHQVDHPIDKSEERDQAEGKQDTIQADGGEEPPKPPPASGRRSSGFDDSEKAHGPEEESTSQDDRNGSDVDIGKGVASETTALNLNPTKLRIEADRPFEGKSKERSAFEEILEHARLAEVIEGDIVTPSSVLHCEIRRSEGGATITIADMDSWKEAIGFGLSATVDGEVWPSLVREPRTNKVTTLQICLRERRQNSSKQA